MRLLACLALLAASLAAHADTIEGYWQDSARRILFDRSAPPGFAYGGWERLDLEQTYPSAKQVRRSPSGYDLVELLYDDEERVDVRRSADDGIDFVRTTKWSGCAMHHRCSLQGAELLCSLVNVCPDGGKGTVDWRGEERYVRREACERDGKRQAQGIPVRCR